VDAGTRYSTVDFKISYIEEWHAGDAITVTTRITQGQRKKRRLQHAMHHQDGRLLATSEVLLIHVDLSTRKSCLLVSSLLRSWPHWPRTVRNCLPPIKYNCRNRWRTKL
jgi:acyl-CoA thioesterase FadM